MSACLSYTQLIINSLNYVPQDKEGEKEMGIVLENLKLWKKVAKVPIGCSMLIDAINDTLHPSSNILE